MFERHHRWFPEPLEDVRRAIRFIRHGASAYGIDSERLGGFGASSGAHLLALAAFMPDQPSKQTGDPIEREGTRLQALVLRTAPVDLTDPKAAGSPNVVALFGMISPEGTAARTSASWRTYAAASPITYVSKGAPPTLLIHGDADQVVSIEQSTLLEAALRQQQVPTRLLTIPGGVHGGARFGLPDDAVVPANWPDYLEEMISWFDRYLRASDNGKGR